ncbi:Phage terminase large subunit (GpA) [Stieleria neptunia]|uniref:Phage terminase large subunit (GpA) n=1 Tax=Stieleria neptunia TaxID=2527979 RepID=A0A518HU91_9BACT|nr:terminase gpA endonuclease subunit [Stieleria neptunia]QDV44377.1 Phage terminase large subunit (GpA) [Stieleria neptunia]
MANKRRDQKNESQNRINAQKRDIGDLPPAPEGELAELRRRCDESLRFFLEYCFPAAFFLGWSDDHLRLIAEIERIGIRGGLKAIAHPRSGGKTAILVRALLWLILTRHRRFAVIIASTAKKAKELLTGIKTILLHNQCLHELYPQELHAILSLGGEGKKGPAQTSNGTLTGVVWNTEQIGFGVVDGCPLKGAGISAIGLTSGNIRGQQLVLPDGTILRPDVVLPDDPQTKKSAKSPSQNQERYELIMGDVLGMAGPSKAIAALCACTVIYDDDLSSRLLDREQSPEWQGDTCAMVYEWPANEEIWEEYREIRHAELRIGGDGSAANQFVRDNYEEMHTGSRVGWEARKGSLDEDDDTGTECVSALQYAYNLRFQDEATFFSEYQNAPLTSVIEKRFDLKADDLAARIGGDKRNVVPAECEKITAFADCQGNVLFYIVVAWTSTGRGHVIDYGTYPDQKKSYFAKRQIRYTLQKAADSDILNEAIYAGLEVLTDQLLTRTYKRGDGAAMRIDRMGIDVRWGHSTRVIRRFCRESQHIGKLHPMMGQYIGSDNRPWNFWTHKKGMRLGVHCRMQPPPQSQPGAREILVDTNWWKSWAAERLSTVKGSDRAILLFKASPTIHRMIAEHWTAEDAIDQEGRNGNVVTEWKQSHSGIENDLWDCLIGASVLAHIEGIAVEDGVQKSPAAKATTRPKKRRRKVSPLAC